MDAFNLERFSDYLEMQGLQAALLSNPATLTWLSGYAPPIQTGPSPFEGGPALGWWAEGQLTLILADAESGAASASGAILRSYLSYSLDEPLNGAQHQSEVLQQVLQQAGGLRGKVGVELNFLNARMASTFHQFLPEVKVQPLDGAFDLLRAVKSPAEIERIQAALHLCDLAQSFTAQQAAPGKSEIVLWGALKAHLEEAAGGRLPILADFVAGPRTSEVGGLPGPYILQEGDAVIADIVPRLNGYWGDNAGTHFAGRPSVEMSKIYRIVRETLRKGVESVRPGQRASDLDRMLRGEITAHGYPSYPHHSGHGIGATFHEEPRLVSYNDLLLQENMVVAIEPGIYVPGVGGVRLEDVVLVTQDGCRLLTHHLE